MTKLEIINLFDNEEYQKVYELTNPYNKENILDYELLYYLKSKLVLDNFKILNKEELKKILFYYFYLVGHVDFDNGYSFSFKKNILKLDFNNLDNGTKGLKDFKIYFDLGKNLVFLDKIIDTTVNKKKTFKNGVKKVNNIVDFFIYFTYECSQLYAFSGEHFPLFKWLINELTNE